MDTAPAPVGAFEMIMERSRHPMVVVTAAVDPSDPAGCLVGFHTRCSSDPPRYLICLSDLNRTYEVAVRAGVLAVHHLEAGHGRLARRFGEMTGHDGDKFAGVAWSPGPEGTPILADVPAWWVGEVVATVDLGDHRGFVLAPCDGRAGPEVAPFTADQARDFEAGNALPD